MVAFYLKKIISRLLFPLPLALEFILLGVYICYKNKKKRNYGIGFVVFGAVFLFLVSSEPFMDQVLYPFEHRYLPLNEIPKEPISYIVVLGGGHDSNEFLPPNSELQPLTLPRVIESIRLKKMFPGAKLIYSGGKIKDQKSNAQVMKEVAVLLGVPATDILVEETSLDTREEVLNLKRLLKGKNFVLVTSATHMQRALLLFQKEGLNPIPSPSPYLTRKTSNYTLWEYFPSYKGVQKSERLFYELLGLLWSDLKGYI
ncbi:MAG TPA: envelope biogenesis factor ElyC [Desulfonauticus sp.]|nr:hypothetical protein [Desulfonauticus sp.]HCO12353.1 envelope biogenesis factor ElyC [Desulfonauticus sp.]